MPQTDPAALAELDRLRSTIDNLDAALVQALERAARVPRAETLPGE